MDQLENFFEKMGVNSDVQKELNSSGSGHYIWNELENGGTVNIRTLIDFCLF